MLFILTYKSKQNHTNRETSWIILLTFDITALARVLQLKKTVEDLKMYTSYITGMLSNLGPMPLERIHNMLKVIVASGSEHKYNKTPQQLTSLLQQLCREEKVESCADGRYEVIKK